MFKSQILPQKRHYSYENITQFYSSHQPDTLAPDRRFVFYAIKSLIEDLAKNKITYYPKFYQFLNTEVHLNHKLIKALAYELDSNYLKIYFQEKAKKNFNGSDINVIISYVTFYRSTDLYYHIMYFLHKNNKNHNLFVDRLNELIESVLLQSKPEKVEADLSENYSTDLSTKCENNLVSPRSFEISKTVLDNDLPTIDLNRIFEKEYKNYYSEILPKIANGSIYLNRMSNDFSNRNILSAGTVID